MEFNLVPRFDQGRTATHEVGHWLRLSHVWGDGGCDIDDGIGDTPSAAGPNYGCNVGSLACRGDSLNMVQNYMDYSDDACMNLFTRQQVDLMRKAFASRGSRVSILSSKGCMAPAQNEVYFTINFDEFPQDISWELRNSSDSIVASDGNFDPGDEILGIPAPLANKSKVYRLDFPDGNYTLTIYDSFGDGFPGGDYKISTVHNEVIIQGTGDFASQLSRSFTLNDFKYRFVGGSATGSIVDWYNPTNWNRRSSPSDCYEGDIIIESDCVKNDGLEINLPNEFIVKDGVQFSVNN